MRIGGIETSVKLHVIANLASAHEVLLGLDVLRKLKVTIDLQVSQL